MSNSEKPDQTPLDDILDYVDGDVPGASQEKAQRSAKKLFRACEGGKRRYPTL